MAQLPEGVWEIGQNAPIFWREAAKADQISLDADECVVRIDGENYHFLRGRLSIPVQKGPREFSWLVWVSVSTASWSELSAGADASSRRKPKPIFGWLSSELPFETTTVGLPTTLTINDDGELPPIWINIASKHALGTEQRQGITIERLNGIRRGDVRMDKP